MTLEPGDLLEIQKLLNTELKQHIDDFKGYMTDFKCLMGEKYETKLMANEKLSIFKEKHVDPLALKVYGFSAVISGLLIVAGFISK